MGENDTRVTPVSTKFCKFHDCDECAFDSDDFMTYIECPQYKRMKAAEGQAW